MRIGLGWDLHTLSSNRPLLLGGVTIPSQKGEEGHSDGDVLIHAIIDALLGAAGFQDIGTQFPPSDPQYKNISSLILLKKVMRLINSAGYSINNVDTTVILEEPKIGPFIDQIKNTISAELNIPLSSISIKAKTKEGVDATGHGNAIEALAIVLLTTKT